LRRPISEDAMKSKRLCTAVIVAVLASVALAQSSPAAAQDASEHYFFYQLVLLLRPANRPQIDQEAAEKLQEAHMANIRKLAKEGKLVLAGPFLDDTPLRGIFVLKTQSFTEATKWTRTDPSVQSGRLAPEIHTWIQTTSTFSKPPESNPMENYALVIYVKGDNFHWPTRPDPTAQRHLDYIQSLRESGKLAAGAPFRDGSGSSAELLIFATSLEETSQIVAQDPWVVAGMVKPEVHPWMTQKGVLPK
jgi:uncharacterized protein YciI